MNSLIQGNLYLLYREFEIKDTTKSASSVSFLDISLEMKIDSHLTTNLRINAMTLIIL